MALETTICVRRHGKSQLAGALPRLEAFACRGERVPPARHPAWLNVLEHGLRHEPYCLEAVVAEQTVGILPLAYVSSLLFGRFLVGLPYLNTGGVLADDSHAARALVDEAVQLANELDVRYLELRHERPMDHPSLNQSATGKVHMRLELPPDAEQLWKDLSPKVRNQIRKGQKAGLSIYWGLGDLLDDFYRVFSHNMRDLGTPAYGRTLFQSILEQFPDAAEICVVRLEQKAIAAALLVHGKGTSEVPSASSLRRFNSTCANMLMYWHLLERSVERGQHVFDFGRSSVDSSTYRFKEQWGSHPFPAHWQYHVRRGAPSDMRPDSPKYRRRIAIWRRLPLGLTKILGPSIVRGIP